MRSVEESRPCPGLSVPVVTCSTRTGGLVEADQRAVVRFVIQDGYGADIVFAAGTTGEWDRVDNDVRQRVIQLCAEEVAKANARLGPDQGRAVEAWAGITAHSPERDPREPRVRHRARRRRRRAGAALDPGRRRPGALRGARRGGSARPASPTHSGHLYDNADIAVDPKVPHIRTRQVKAHVASRLRARHQGLGARARCSATTRRRRRASASAASSASTWATPC